MINIEAIPLRLLLFLSVRYWYFRDSVCRSMSLLVFVLTMNLFCLNAHTHRCNVMKTKDIMYQFSDQERVQFVASDNYSCFIDVDVNWLFNT